MTFTKLTQIVLGAASALILTACGGGGGSAAMIGGSVIGLSTGLSISLQNNGADTVTFTGNGSNSFTFTFPTGLGDSSPYAVTVSAQPLGQTCNVLNASGNTDSSGDNVNSVVVNCATTASVVGTISGLKAGVGVILAVNGTNTSLLGNGSTALSGILATGSTYTVSVAVQPSGQTCTVTKPTGTVVTNASAVVTVTCV
jgi:hypothetical protein